MLKIYFIFITQNLEIPALECNEMTTFAELYQYVNQATEHQFEATLSHDQIDELPSDDTTLGAIFPNEQEIQILVSLTAKQNLDVELYIDRQIINEQNISDDFMVSNYIEQALANIQEYSQFKEYQIFDENHELILSCSHIPDAPFRVYTKNQYKKVIINLIRQKQELSQNLSRPISNKMENIEEENPLNYLVILSNASLLIDPEGHFVAYKFHRPLQNKGQLQRSNGQTKAQIANIKLDQLNWIQKNNIQYAQIEECGLAVKWNNDTYSCISLQ